MFPTCTGLCAALLDALPTKIPRIKLLSMGGDDKVHEKCLMHAYLTPLTFFFDHLDRLA